MKKDPFPLQKLISTTPICSVVHLDTVGSTNDHAKELIAAASETLPVPMLISADKQTAGRGRGSKKWWTGEGAIAVSLLLKLSDHGLDRDNLTSLSPLIAKAIAETVSEFIAHCGISGKNVEIHLPNDVYISGKKVCGILIESPKPDFCIIGIGVNTNNTLADAPPEFRDLPITTILDETDHSVDSVAFLTSLFNRVFSESMPTRSEPTPFIE